MTEGQVAMYYSEIKYCDIADGEGVRTSLFVSGCRRHCPGCFNAVTWDFCHGKPFDKAAEDEIIASLEPFYVDGLTVLGGEPMEPENQRALLPFLRRVKERFPEKDIWCFTGDTIEALLGLPLRTGDTAVGEKYLPGVTEELLGCIDVLVDGAFREELHDITLRFRGSSNQRIIDVPATLARLREGADPEQAVAAWKDDPVFATHAM